MVHIAFSRPSAGNLLLLVYTVYLLITSQQYNKNKWSRFLSIAIHFSLGI